jgi:hypothetical protein
MRIGGVADSITSRKATGSDKWRRCTCSSLDHRPGWASTTPAGV